MGVDLEHLTDEFEKLHDFVMIDGGQNNPSLATRVTLTEKTVASISSNLNRMVWLLVGIFVTIIADIAVHSVAHL